MCPTWPGRSKLCDLFVLYVLSARTHQQAAPNYNTGGGGKKEGMYKLTYQLLETVHVPLLSKPSINSMQLRLIVYIITNLNFNDKSTQRVPSVQV